MAYIGNNLQVAFESYQNIDDISSSFDGSTTSFALQVGGVAPTPFPKLEQNVLISVGGVIQKPDSGGTTGFKFTGTNIVFSSAPATSESFFGVILAGADYVNAGTNFPVGAVGTPSVTFKDDEDTGLYHPSANTVSVTTGGTERATFASNGLGIGEGTPDVRLHVTETFNTAYTVDNATTESNNLVKLENPSSTANAFAGIAFRTGSGADMYFGSVQQSANDGDFYFANQNSTNKELLRITSSGEIQVKDDGKYVCGDGDDLQIYHDGTDSKITNGTNDLIVESTGDDVFIKANDDVFIKVEGGAETAIECHGDGNVELYYAHVKKFETTDAGAQITSAGADYGLQVNSTGTGVCRLQSTKGTDEGVELSLMHNSSSMADGDMLGYIQFSGADDQGAGTIYGAMIGYATDVTQGTTDGELKFFTRDNGTFSLKLTIASDGTFTGSSSNDISDQRLKENITTVTNATDKIKALKGRTFTWKPEAKLPGGTHYGFIAQEVESVVSDLVDDTVGIRQFDKDGNLLAQDDKAVENHDEGTTYAKSVNAIGVVPILVEALKEAITEIETLKTKVSALEAK